MDTLPYDMACGCGGKTAMKYSTCLITLGFHRAQGMMSSMQRLWRNLGRPGGQIWVSNIYILCILLYHLCIRGLGCISLCMNGSLSYVSCVGPAKMQVQIKDPDIETCLWALRGPAVYITCGHSELYIHFFHNLFLLIIVVLSCNYNNIIFIRVYY